MFHHMDPHLRKQCEFGVPGNTVKIENETYVGCVVIGAAPHTNCPMYRLTKAMSEKQHRKKLIESGEFGSRDSTIQRLGFHFHDIKKEKIEKLQVNEDGKLKQMAFSWSVGAPSKKKEEENRKSREEGELLAAKMSSQYVDEKKENKNKNMKQKIEDKVIKSSQTQNGKSQFKTNVNEVGCKQCSSQNVHKCLENAENKLWMRRGGWPNCGGLRGGAEDGKTSNEDEAFVFHDMINVFRCESKPNGYQCCMCSNVFSQLGRHISTSKCGEKVDVKRFTEELKKYLKSKNRAKCMEKKLADNSEGYRQKEANRARQSRENKLAENPEEYRQQEANRIKEVREHKLKENAEELRQKEVKSQKKSKLKSQSDEKKALIRFQRATRYGPKFICSCCYTRQFEENSMKLEKAKKKIGQDIYNKCIPEGQEVPIVIWLNDVKSEDCYICKTCFNRLKKGKMPPECRQNNMQIDPQLEEMKLNELERSLMSRNIQFQKIYQLSTSRYTALKDKIINVPVPEGSALNTINSLPRTPNEVGLIGIEVKRKLAFKNPHHTGRLIDVKKIYKAIDILKKAGNPYYQFYDDYHTYEERCVNNDDDNLIASALHDGWDEEIMKDLADLDINEHSDDDKLLQRNLKELAKRIQGGDKCISQCINPAGYEQCAIAIIPISLLGHHAYWQRCSCELSILFSNCLGIYLKYK